LFLDGYQPIVFKGKRFLMLKRLFPKQKKKKVDLLL